MRYPSLPIPQQLIGRDLLDRYKSLIGKYQLAFCDAGELGLFALLPKVSVLPVFGDLAVEHAGGCGTVDVSILGEDLHAPGLPCEPREHPRFDRREVRDNEPISLPGDEGSSYKLGKRIGHIAIEQLHRLVITAFHQGPSNGEVLDAVSFQILSLN